MSAVSNHLPLILPLAGGAAAFATLAAVSVAPRCRVWGDVVCRGPADGPARVALTFDDGPTEGSTDPILDVLRETNTHAAFFVVGANVRRWPHLVRRMHDEGHVVANHSFDHSHYGFFRGRRYWQRQIAETDDAIEEIIGVRPRLFRPPMGVKTWCIAGAARRADHTTVTWTRRGFDGIAATPERICARLADGARGGDVLLLHDGVEPNSRRDPRASVAAVRPLIRRLVDREIRLVRLDEFIGVAAYASSDATPREIETQTESPLCSTSQTRAE